MTKTFTEQWREGTLPDGAYYILVDKYEQNEPEIDVGVCYNSNFEWWIVKEVIAPVPSYDVWKNIKEQWKVAIPQIERLQERNEKLEKMAFQYTPEEWNTMLRTIERLQERLKEANEVIKKYMSVAFEIRSEEEKPTVLQLAFDYLEKWGVK